MDLSTFLLQTLAMVWDFQEKALTRYCYDFFCIHAELRNDY